MPHRIWNLAMMKRILAREETTEETAEPQKKHRLLPDREVSPQERKRSNRRIKSQKQNIET